MERAHPIVAIPDLHGDPKALRRSLYHADILQNESGPLKIRKEMRDAHAVLLGDYGDRGRDTLGVYALIDQVENEGLSMTKLAGNHDLLPLSALARNDESLSAWALNGGGLFFEEIANEMKRSSFPLTGDIRTDAFNFLQTQHGKLFSSLRVFHQIDDIFFSHSGSIEGEWENILRDEGIDEANRVFQTLLQSRSDVFHAMARDRSVDYARPFWAVDWIDNPIMNETRAGIFKRLGVTTVINGHNRSKLAPFRTSHNTSHGIIDRIDADAGISEAYRGDDEGWAFVKIDTNGHVEGRSNRGIHLEYVMES